MCWRYLKRYRNPARESGRMNEKNEASDLRVIAHRAMVDRGLEPDFPPDAVTFQVAPAHFY